MENRETAAPVCSSAHETMLTPDALLPPDYVVADNTVNTLPKPEASPPPVHPVPDNTMYALPIYNPPAHPMTFKDPSYSTSNGSGKNVVVTTQPTTVMIPSQSYERDYLGFSIFTLLFCFLPIGLVALIFSIKTRAANTRGDRPTASRNSRTALILNKTALVLGIKVIAACVAGLIYYYTTGGTAYTQTTCYSYFYNHYC
ncbi:interferon-induced transmembrane protein 2-like [Ambystoma mexicanum]|uniref:interferon-induced transmembrane protein 2-like n=1 Tax=Ambystoma mexicanum TaxID=8296 RepID=UPI0037E82B38